MESNLKNLLENRYRYRDVEDKNWVYNIIDIADYYTNGNGINDFKQKKIISTLNAIVENYLTIKEGYYDRSYHGSPDLVFDGYDIKSRIPRGIGYQIEKLSERVYEKLREEEIKDPIAKNIYEDLREL